MCLMRAVTILTAITLAGAGTATAQAAGAGTRAARTPHAIAGKTECLSCHGAGASQHVKSVPQTHRYANAACVTCHRVAERLPPKSSHAMDAAHTRCAVCHVANNRVNAKATPASHGAYDASTCAMCHVTASGG
jgi:hypothetical protein